jgi:hypothetical protein
MICAALNQKAQKGHKKTTPDAAGLVPTAFPKKVYSLR